MSQTIQLFGVVFSVTIFYRTCVLGQVSSLCRPNERFLTCGGCQRTCLDPAPACAAVCREGCYCPDDFVRNMTGHCVPLSECPSNYSAYKDTSEPRPKELKCGENEEYKFCETCFRTCHNPNPICPSQCTRGCFCKDGFVKNTDGRCVELSQCNKREWDSLMTKINSVINQESSQNVCGPNQEFKQCGPCEILCDNLNPRCSSQCVTGCFCKPGFVKTSTGQCVTLVQCPKSPNGKSLLSGLHELTVEDCAPDEEFLSCGWCEPTCSDPQPQCPVGVCTRGCLCRPPLVRHFSGQCVDPKYCLPQRCPHPNEEYVCRYGCEMRCDRRGCDSRPRGCSLGCHCKLGYMRDLVSGTCVLPRGCPNTTDLSSFKPVKLTLHRPINITSHSFVIVKKQPSEINSTLTNTFELVQQAPAFSVMPMYSFNEFGEKN